MIGLILLSLYQNVMWYQQPAKDWEYHALPVGNGHMGAMLFGEIVNDTMQYNDKTFWSGGPGCPGYTFGNNKDAWKPWKELQQKLVKTRQPDKDLLQRMLGNNNCFGTYQSFGNIVLYFHNITTQNVTDYRRELDLDKSVHKVTFLHNGKKHTRETFASYPKRVIISQLSTDDEKGISVTINNKGTHDKYSNYTNLAFKENNTIVLRGQLIPGISLGSQTDVTNDIKYESQLLVKTDGGTVSNNGDQFIITEAKSVTLILTTQTDYQQKFPNYRTVDPHSEIEQRMKIMANKSYAELLLEHQIDYRPLFDKVELNFNDSLPAGTPTDQLLKQYKAKPFNAMEVLLFQYGRYLSISSSRKDTLPANLQGVWNKELNPTWSSDYHININLQMNYWANAITGLMDPDYALVDFVYNLIEPGKQTARDHFNVTGWCVHTASNTFGNTAPGPSSEWGWNPAGAAWIVQNVYDYFQFSQDVKALKEKIYPAMKGAAEFYSNILVDFTDNTTNKTYLVNCPQLSSEHERIEQVANYYDTSLIRQLYLDLINASRILNTTEQDKALLELVQKQLAQLLPYKIGKHGQLQEWYDDIDNPDDHHRHISHLLGLYPGKQFDKYLDKDLMDAVKVSLNFRGDINPDPQVGQPTGWSMAHKINAWARLDGERSHKLIEHILQMKMNDNLFDEHPPFQIDGNFGFVSGVAENLVQSHLGYVQIIPMMPKAWSAGYFKGIMARGNFTVDCSFANQKIINATILSGSGLDFVFDDAQASKFKVLNDQQVEIQTKYISDHRFSFKTEKNKKYFLIKE